MPTRSRSRSRISLAPVAISSHREVMVGLGYCSTAKTIDKLLEFASTTPLKSGEKLFVGVVLDQRRRDDALRRLDDAAAEIAARSEVGAPVKPASKRRGQR